MNQTFELRFDRDLTEAEQALVGEVMQQITEQAERPPTALENLLVATFTDREYRLIVNCQVYACNDPAGLPGHNLMVIIQKFDELVGMLAGELTDEQLEKVIADMHLLNDEPMFRLKARLGGRD